jgi:membrane protein required for beta-lactamase induction
MTFSEWVGTVFIFVGVLVMAGFIATEMNRWLVLRREEKEAPVGMTSRMIRRSLGAFLLLVVLLLVKYPSRESLTDAGLFFKYLVCLWLCVMVFLIAIYDLRSIRRELRSELSEDYRQATNSLHALVEEFRRQTEVRNGNGAEAGFEPRTAEDASGTETSGSDEVS